MSPGRSHLDRSIGRPRAALEPRGRVRRRTGDSTVLTVGRSPGGYVCPVGQAPGRPVRPGPSARRATHGGRADALTTLDRCRPRPSARQRHPRGGGPRAQPARRLGRHPARRAGRSSPACRGAGSRASRSTRSTPRGSGATSRACRPTRASSSARWTSRTSTTSRACRRRSRSTRRPRAATRARRWRPSPRSTTTCACSSRGSASRTARSAAGPITGQSVEQIADQVLALPEGTRFLVLAPLVRDRKGEHRDVLEQIRGEGFTRVAVDGDDLHARRGPGARQEVRPHDRGRGRPAGDARRPAAAAHRQPRDRDAPGRRPGAHRGGPARRRRARSWTYSERFACPEHGASLPELAPRTFSFNSPHGACPQCTGLGFTLEVDPELVVDPERTPRRGRDPAVDRPHHRLLRPAARRDRRPARRSTSTRPWRDAARAAARPPARRPEAARAACSSARRRKGAAAGAGSRASCRSCAASTPPRCRTRCATSVEQFMSLRPCPACGGARLQARDPRGHRGGPQHPRGLPAVGRATRSPSSPTLELTRHPGASSARASSRRSASGCASSTTWASATSRWRAPPGTLSGGEAQRIRLATQIGSGLVGVLYILDEPSIGLHQRDNRKLIGTLERLRDQGNTVLVVEHDEEMIRSAGPRHRHGPGRGPARRPGGGRRGRSPTSRPSRRR